MFKTFNICYSIVILILLFVIQAGYYYIIFPYELDFNYIPMVFGLADHWNYFYPFNQKNI